MKYIDRLRDTELMALIEFKNDRLKECLEEQKKLQEELNVLIRELMNRGLNQ